MFRARAYRISSLLGVGGARGGHRWPAWVVLALLCVLWQGFVTQTHVHWDRLPPVPTGAALAAGSPVAAAGPLHRSQHPADCPICREIAHAGAYVVPLFTPVFLGSAQACRAISTGLGRLAPSARPSRWRIRGPPSPAPF